MVQTVLPLAWVERLILLRYLLGPVLLPVVFCYQIGINRFEMARMEGAVVSIQLVLLEKMLFQNLVAQIGISANVTVRNMKG